MTIRLDVHGFLNDLIRVHYEALLSGLSTETLELTVHPQDWVTLVQCRFQETGWLLALDAEGVQRLRPLNLPVLRDPQVPRGRAYLHSTDHHRLWTATIELHETDRTGQEPGIGGPMILVRLRGGRR